MIFEIMFAPVLVVALHVLAVYGFIPAQPSNATIREFDVATSRLDLQWYGNGSDWLSLSHQLVPAGTNGMSRGVLVHFSEDCPATETTTPWIAFVSCDANSTNSSQVDIFTMAEDLGARAAVLYSLYSETCVLNTEYMNVTNPKKGFSIFATPTIQASRRIEYDFGRFGSSDVTPYKNYNATLLNQAATKINLSATANHPVSSGFLLAAIQAFNYTGTPPTIWRLQADTNVTTTAQSGGSSQTGVAMIVLYAITGFVSALFCSVIVSGAIKAIRHPERYGPRADPAQSRARGLGRAILDTFPVVKFRPVGGDQESSLGNGKDVESSPATIIPSDHAARPSSVELHEMGRAAEVAPEGQGVEAGVGGSRLGKGVQTSAPVEQDGLPPSTTANGEASNTTASAFVSSHEQDTRMPESIGREICPICIVDFEEGDDLRVLPCEGKHRFHQACVDPWLLELSGSCPICREDFHALEAIISGESGMAGHAGQSSMQGRLSRYLRFARVRQQRRGSRHGPPP